VTDNLVDQVASNIHDEHNSTKVIQSKSNQTIDSIILLHTPEPDNSIISNENSYQSKGKLFCN